MTVVAVLMGVLMLSAWSWAEAPVEGQAPVESAEAVAPVYNLFAGQPYAAPLSAFNLVVAAPSVAPEPVPQPVRSWVSPAESGWYSVWRFPWDFRAAELDRCR